MLKNRSNQKDTGLGYNGMSNGSSQKPSAPAVMVNKHTGYMNDGRDVNVGMKSAARTGNGAGKTAGPNTAKGGKIDGGRSFMPSGGQNFKGDPDKIQMTQMPNRTGNKC